LFLILEPKNTGKEKSKDKINEKKSKTRDVLPYFYISPTASQFRVLSVLLSPVIFMFGE